MYTKQAFLVLTVLSGFLFGCHKNAVSVPDPWQKIKVSNNQTVIYNMTEIHFSSPQVGWISGGIDKELMGNPVLLKTTDGGTTWSSIDLSSLYISRFIAFYPLNDQIAYACAPDKSIVLGAGRKMCKSIDGGLSWFQLKTSNIIDTHALCFLDEQVGLSANISTLQKTTDGGTTWRTVYSESLAGLDKLQLFATGTGYAAGGAGNDQLSSVGILLKTQDKGDTWQKIPWPYGDITTLSFLNDRVGFAGVLNRHLYKTVDGGNSWQLADGLTPGTSRGIFLSEQEGYLAGVDIERTPDGGRSWQVEHTIPGPPTGDIFSAIGFSPAGVGIAVTNRGLILKR